MNDLVLSAFDALWQQAFAVIPLVVAVVCLSRWLPLRPATRHMMWLTVLVWMVAVPLLPVAPSVQLSQFIFAESGSTPVAAPLETATPGKVWSDPDLAQNRPKNLETYRSVETSVTGTEESTASRTNDPTRRDATAVTAGPNSSSWLARAIGPCGSPQTSYPFCDGDSTLAPPVSAGFEEPAQVSVEVPSSLDASLRHVPFAADPLPTAAPAGLVPAKDDVAAGGLLAWLVSEGFALKMRVVASIAQLGSEASVLLETWTASYIAVAQAVLNWPPLPPSVWFGGAALMGLVGVWRLIRFRRYVGSSTRAPGSVRALVREAAKVYGLKRLPETRMVTCRVSPMVWAGCRLVLIIPKPLWSQLDAAGRRAVIFHEMAHIRRRDHWVSWAEVCIGLVYWWHPLVWWVRGRLRTEAELSCDAWVTTLLPGERRAYAQVLLQSKQYVYGERVSRSALEIGMTTGRAGRFARRLTMVMTSSVKPQLSLPGVAMIVCLALTGWLTTPVRSSPPSDKAAPCVDSVKVVRAEVAPVVAIVDTPIYAVSVAPIVTGQGCGKCKVKGYSVASTPCVDCKPCKRCKKAGASGKCADCKSCKKCIVSTVGMGSSRCCKSCQSDCCKSGGIFITNKGCGQSGCKNCSSVLSFSGPKSTFNTYMAARPALASKPALFRTYTAVPFVSPAISGVAPLMAVLGAGDDDDDRMDALEKRLEKLSHQIERMMDQQFGSTGKSKAKAEVRGKKARKQREAKEKRAYRERSTRRPDEPRPPRAPRGRTAPSPPSPPGHPGDGFFGNDNQKEIVRTYKLPKGKLQGLTELMVRDDVPIRVRPLDDGIEVHGTPRQQRIFGAFIRMIDPQGDHGAQVWPMPDHGDLAKHMLAEALAQAGGARLFLGSDSQGSWREEVEQAQYIAREHAHRARELAREHRVRIERELRGHTRELREQLREVAREAGRFRQDADRMRDHAEEVREEAERVREEAERVREERESGAGERTQVELKETVAQLVAHSNALERESSLIERQANELERQAEARERDAEELDSRAEELRERLEEEMRAAEEAIQRDLE